MPRQAALSARLDAAEALAQVGTYEYGDGRFINCSPQFRRIHGYPEDGLAIDCEEFLRRIDSDDRDSMRAAMAESLASGKPYELRYRVKRDDGTKRIVRGCGRAVPGPEARRLVLGAAQDVTEQEYAVSRLVAAESRYSAIVEHANDGIWILDQQERTTFVNGALCEMFDLPPTDLLGRTPSELTDDPLPDLMAERRTQFECRFRRRGGAHFWTVSSLSRLPETHGGGVLLVLSDITRRKNMEQRLRDAAERDPLTDLVSRAHFEVLMEGLLKQGSRRRSPLALLFIDIDHFKYVNDSFGHAVGDGLLKEIGLELGQLVRDGDIVGRFGGDEFVVALPETSLDTARAVAERIVETIRERRWGALNRLTVSIGIGMAVPRRKTSSGELLIAADAALHQAKSNGRDQVCLSAGRQGTVFHWIDEIRAALDEDRLVLHAQVIRPMSVAGAHRFELLVRMRARDGTLIPPGAFIPAAEQFGLMTEVDRWVVAHGLSLAHRGTAVQINLSGKSLGDKQILRLVESAISGGLDPGRLTFEVTETTAFRNLESAREFAQQLQRLGCSFALDDFGTGFGSLTYLKHLPVSHLKIDIEFVRDLVRCPADQRLVTAVLAMAKALGLKTVAEGVEDAQTLEMLRALGADYVQGFGVGRPFELDLHSNLRVEDQPAGLVGEFSAGAGGPLFDRSR